MPSGDDIADGLRAAGCLCLLVGLVIGIVAICAVNAGCSHLEIRWR